MNSADWVPSHVRITIHQARELLLKNKSAQSELYISIHTEKDKLVSAPVPRSTTPEWKFTTEIPLMSLDTTVHLTVRQKGRLTDDFIGYISIPLGGFSLNSKQVTHWYKLGSKPGKANVKLRGDLLVTIKLLSNWIQFADTYTAVSGTTRKIFPVTGKAMLKRSKSDVKIKLPESPSLPKGALAEKTNHNPSKMKGKMSAFRKSFRKKTKSPIFQECDEDFTTFSPPTQFRARSHTIDASSVATPRSQSTSLASVKDGSSSESENGISDKALSQSPSLRPSVQALFAEAAVLENEDNHDSTLKEKEDSDVNLSPAARFYSFRSKKKRWSMHTLPITTPSPTHQHTLGLSDQSDSQVFTVPTTTHPDSMEDEMYVAKSNSIAHSPKLTRTRTKSYCNSDSQQSVRSLSELEVDPESCSEATTPGYSPQMVRKTNNMVREPESGYNTSSSVQNKVKQSSISEELNSDTCSDLTKKDVVRTGTKTASVKRTQSQRKLTDSPSTRRTVTSPGLSRTRQSLSRKGNASPTQSPVSIRARPRMLSTGGPSTKRTETKSKTISSSRTSSTVSTPNRTPGLSRTPSGSRPLSNGRSPRTSRVREKTSSLQRRPKSMIETSNNSQEIVKPKNTKKAVVVVVNKDKLDTTEEISSPVIAITHPVTDSVTELEADNQITSLPNTTPEIEEVTRDSGNQSDATVAQSSEDKTLPEESPPIAEPTLNIESDNLSQSSEELNTSSVSQSLEPQLGKDIIDQVTHEQAPATDKQTLPSSPENKKPKHTVAYSQESPLFKDGFQPVSLLPPSLMEYQTQTLPTRGKLTRRVTDNNFSDTTRTARARPSTISSCSQEAVTPSRTDSLLRQKANRSPENIRLIHRRSMNFSLLSAFNQANLNSIPQSPTSDSESSSLAHDEADGNGRENVEDRSLSRLSASTMVSCESDSRPSTPSTPVKYGGKTPGEIVTSALRSRKQTGGGLRQAINMYQENRKQRREEKTSPNKRRMASGGGDRLQVETECLDRASVSAESSPQLRRNHSAASSFSNILNPLSSLRRTRSHASSSPSAPRRQSVGDFSSTNMSILSLRVPSNSLSSINDTTSEASLGEPASIQLHEEDALSKESSVELSTSTEDVDSSNHLQKDDTTTLTDTSSVKTLTEVECNRVSSRRTSSPNPAGAVTGTHIRHTTCSSIGSEGFGSFTSEELSLEELAQRDWAHWTKEELVKELIHSKQRLKSTEQELKDVKNYLDNLLLRIMETDPLLLSSIPSS